MIKNIITSLLFCLNLLSIQAKDIENLVIVGSGPAGLTAAIYAARADLSPLLLEGPEVGGQLTLSYQVENFPGFPEGINGYELIEKMRSQALQFGTSIQSESLISVDLSKSPFILTTTERTLLTHSLIVASGASAKWLNIESEKQFIGKGVSSCATCDGAFYKNQEVVVVGGGDSALEDALFLSKFASKITVVHRGSSLRASKHLQNQAFANPKIHFLWNQTVEEFLNSSGRLTGVRLLDILSQKESRVNASGVFIAIGHQPNTRIFEDYLDLDESGYVVTQSHSSKTNVPGVFAAGDVADPHYRQAITAAGSGSMAAIDANHYLQKTLNKE